MSEIKEFLEERIKKNLLRILQPAEFRKGGKIYFNGKEYYDFSSNDYLGFCDNNYLKDASRKAISELGVGAGASRLLSGDYDVHHQLEKETALFKGKESALIFNSGYQANVGIISSLYSKNAESPLPDVIFIDKLNHASIYDGVLLSGARFFRFRHNDMNHLETLMKKQRHKYNKSIIITETVFSMDGDIPPLKEIIFLKEKYNSWIMADEAHATGIFGQNGGGVLEKEGLINKVELIMGTFSKALGSFGAYLACNNEIKQYLINTCRSFIYSTALPPSVIEANLAALQLLKKEPQCRKSLLENADYFRSELKKSDFEVKGNSQIVPLILGSSDKTVMLSEKLKNCGYWALPIRPPTVSRGESRLRFSLTYYHTKEILKKLVKCLSL